MANHSKTLWLFGGTSELGNHYAREREKLGYYVERISRKDSPASLWPTRIWNSADLDSISSTLESISFKLGDEVVIANGALGPFGGWEQILASELSDLEAMVAANLSAPSLTLLHALKEFSKLGGGRIVLLSSLAGHPVLPINPLYGQMKRMVDDLAVSASRSKATRLSKVDVVIARIGFVQTRLNAGRDQGGFGVSIGEVTNSISKAARGVVWCPAHGWMAKSVLTLPLGKRMASALLELRAKQRQP